VGGRQERKFGADEVKGSDMSVGDQRFETRMPSFKAASAADDRCGRNKWPYQITTYTAV
jgi:hypothetical protein